jgi:glucose-1-phosphate thymidylyltransferase
MKENMKTLIIAGGFSTRLTSFLEGKKDMAKGLLTIDDREIIDFALASLVHTLGNAETALITNSRDIAGYKEFLANKYPHIKVLENGVLQPEDRLGAIGDLALALDRLGWQDDLLVLPSDTISSLELKNLLEFYETHPGFINVVHKLNIETIADSLGCVEFDHESHLITSFEEKPARPKSPYASVPIYIYPKEVIPLIKEYIAHVRQNNIPNGLDSPGKILEWLIQRSDVNCFAFPLEDDGFYFDVGTPEMYNDLNNHPEKVRLNR